MAKEKVRGYLGKINNLIDTTTLGEEEDECWAILTDRFDLTVEELEARGWAVILVTIEEG